MRVLFKMLCRYCAGFFMVLGVAAYADVGLHGLFTDGMVLQQGTKVPVWGTAADGEKVTVKFCGQEVSTTAHGGKWLTYLDKLTAGGPYIMTVSGNNTREIKDVYVGEVWLASGQSNMQWPVSLSIHGEQEVAQASYPGIRLYTVPRQVAQEPQTDVQSRWHACSPETVGSFSAVAYFFGRDLHKARQVPVGLIHSSWGGTPAQSWTNWETLAGTPELKVILDHYAKILERLPTATAKYQEQLALHKDAVAKAKKEGENPPNPPSPPMGPTHPHRPAGLYNAMIAPLLPYAIAGAIWYQGEANAPAAVQYRTLFPTMIRQWRTSWGQGDFPFLFVQLAAFRKITPEPQDTDWAWLREAQLMTLSQPNTAMVVAIDVGDENDIHPRRKQEVGARLALAARAVAYGEKLEYSGPIYHRMTVEGNRVIVHFKHAGTGLTSKDGELTGFAVAGADRHFVWAKAEIAGDTVVISSPQVARPVAVRYAWADYPVCNLYNKEGLPASPFRTDDFPRAQPLYK